MRLSILATISLKNLLLSRLRTVLTLLGVIIGISTIVFLISLGFGLEELVTRQLTTSTAFQIVDLYSTSKLLKLNNDQLKVIKNITGVKAVEPFVQIPANIKYDSTSAEGIAIAGAPYYFKYAQIKAKTGQIPNAGEVIITSGNAKLLAQSEKDLIGKNVTLELILPEDLTGQPEVKKTVEFKIVGIVDDSESSITYLPLSYIEEQGAVNYTGAKLFLTDQKIVPSVRKYVEGLGFKAYYIGDTISQVRQFFDIFRIVLSLFGMVALAVAAVGMFNTLTISLMERTREIGLMKALGFKRKDVHRLFLIEASFLGLVGGILGILTGYLTTKLINFILNLVGQRMGAEAEKIFVTPLWFTLAVLGFAVLVSLTVGIYPARRAVRISPLNALRYE